MVERELAALAGIYTNEHWGSVVVTHEDERLFVRLGNVRGELHGRDDGAIVAYASGVLEDEVAFTPMSGDAPAALLVELSGYPLRFERVP